MLSKIVVYSWLNSLYNSDHSCRYTECSYSCTSKRWIGTDIKIK